MKLVRCAVQQTELLLPACQVRHSYRLDALMPWLVQSQDGLTRAEQLYLSARLLPCTAFLMSAQEVAHDQPDFDAWWSLASSAKAQLVELRLEPARWPAAAPWVSAAPAAASTAWLICPSAPQTQESLPVRPLPPLLRATSSQPWWIGLAESATQPIPLAYAEALFAARSRPSIARSHAH